MFIQVPFPTGVFFEIRLGIGRFPRVTGTGQTNGQLYSNQKECCNVPENTDQTWTIGNLKTPLRSRSSHSNIYYIIIYIDDHHESLHYHLYLLHYHLICNPYMMIIIDMNIRSFKSQFGIHWLHGFCFAPCTPPAMHLSALSGAPCAPLFPRPSPRPKRWHRSGRVQGTRSAKQNISPATNHDTKKKWLKLRFIAWNVTVVYL